MFPFPVGARTVDLGLGEGLLRRLDALLRRGQKSLSVSERDRPVGQDLAQAVVRLFSTRSAQKVHLPTVSLFDSYFGIPQGHAVTQYLHPMHFFRSIATYPLSAD